MRMPGVKQRIMDVLAEFYEWCYNVWETRTLPSHGFYKENLAKVFPNSMRAKNAGKAIMGPWIPIYVATKSDGKARVEMHKMKRWWKCTKLCDGCGAVNPGRNTDPNLTWMDFNLNAGWKGTILSHEDYMANDVASTFSRIPGWNFRLLLRDHAHMDPLGYGRDIGAGIIKSLHKRGELEGADLDCQLRILSKAMRKAKPGKLSCYLTKAACGLDNMYECPAFSSNIKAKRVEIMNKYLCKVCIDLASLPDADEMCKLRGSMCWGYLDVHHTLDNASMFLSDSEVARFQCAGHVFLLNLQALHERDQKHIWKLRPKLHALEHLMHDALHVTRLNPKLICCLGEEDFLGLMKKLVVPLRGLCPLRMMRRILQRYVLHVGMRWRLRKLKQLRFHPSSA